MNWQMVGAIGEVAGAIAVVFTLVYLARQVREASRQDRRTQWIQLGRRSDELRLALAQDPDLATIVIRGLSGLEKLNPEERARFTAWLLTVFEINGSLFHFRLERGIHDSGAAGLDSSVREIVRSPGVQQWYAKRRNWFSEDYAAQIDRWIMEGGTSLADRFAPSESSEP